MIFTVFEIFPVIFSWFFCYLNKTNWNILKNIVCDFDEKSQVALQLSNNLLLLIITDWLIHVYMTGVDRASEAARPEFLKNQVFPSGWLYKLLSRSGTEHIIFIKSKISSHVKQRRLDGLHLAYHKCSLHV